VTRLVVTGANARPDGYTAENLKEIDDPIPDDDPAPDGYARLSPDGAEHWPVVLRRMQPMWATEPDFSPEQLQSIAAPTLLVVGDRDIVRPEHAVEMFNTIPDAQLCIVPNAGHGALPKETVLTFLLEPS
jgi:pimeloyl-ACP methyl ester carboxylesterase